MTLGDRGPHVTALQKALNRAVPALGLVEDGDFGPMTRAAVVEVQRSAGLPPDGIAGEKLLAVLGLK